MVSSLKPYPAYKPSGVEWLGEVPAHWEVRRVKDLFRETDERSGDGKGVLLTFTRRHGIVPHSEVSTRGASALNLSKHKVCKSGHLVMNKMQAWSGMFAVTTVDGLVSPDYSVFAPISEERLCVEYFGHFLKTPQLVEQFAKLSKGIGSGFNRLYTPDFGAVHVVAPQVAEQAAIARYLARADRRIRCCIQARERLVELLEEQRQALVNEAVTGRVDVRTGQPYPAYKPTGVEWLGEVPAHWEVRRLKNVTKFVNGFAFKPADWKAAGVPIIRIENLNGSNEFNHTDRTDLPEKLLIYPQDLLFAWSGNRGTSFGSFAWDREFPAFLNQHIFKLTNYELDRRYFFHLLQSVTKHVEDNAHGIIGLVHITKPALGAICVPLARRSEQAAIARYLDRADRRIRRCIQSAERQIEMLNEYRTRLIADVVTGKLDVREAAAALPMADPLAAGLTTVPE